MRDVTIRDYIGGLKELTAEQVRKSPVGTRVLIHHFDRYGNHCVLDATVARSGKSRRLVYRDFDGLAYRSIRPATDRYCYTEAR